jgi:hypothetical protein
MFKKMHLVIQNGNKKKTVSADFKDNLLTALVDDNSTIGKKRERILSREKSKKWVEHFSELKIKSWRTTYGDKKQTDNIWTLLITDSDNITKRIRGYDEYPENWTDFMRLVNELSDVFDPNMADKIKSIHIRLAYDRKQGTGEKVKPADIRTETIDLLRSDFSMRYVVKIGDAINISHIYQSEYLISSLIDLCSSYLSFFEYSEPVPENPVIPVIEIRITRSDGKESIYWKNYSREYLPDTWPMFIMELYNLMISCGLFGDIFNPNYFYHGIKEGEQGFALIGLSEGGASKTEYYRFNGDSVYIGDTVTITDSKTGNRLHGKVLEIRYFPEDKCPQVLKNAGFIDQNN